MIMILPESLSSTNFSQGVNGEVKSAWFMVLRPPETNMDTQNDGLEKVDL